MGGVASEVGVCGLVGHTAETMVAELHSATAKDIASRPGKGLVRILEEDKPIDLVLLMVGTNDLGKGNHPQDIADDICALHNACHTRGVPTISISPPTGIEKRGWHRANRDRLADILAVRIGARVGADDGVLAHFDVEELLPRTFSGTKHWEPDEIHFSASGSIHLGKILASWILPAVRDAFCPVRSSSPTPTSSPPAVSARHIVGSIRSSSPAQFSVGLGAGSNASATRPSSSPTGSLSAPSAGNSTSRSQVESLQSPKGSLSAPSAGNTTGRSQAERPQSPKGGQLRRSHSPASSHPALGVASSAGPIISVANTTGRSQVESLQSPKRAAPISSTSPANSPPALGIASSAGPIISVANTTGRSQVESLQSPKRAAPISSTSPANSPPALGIASSAGPIISVANTTGRSQVESLQSPKRPALMRSHSPASSPALGIASTAGPILSVGNTTGRSQVESLQSPKRAALMRSSTPTGSAPAPSAGNTTGRSQVERPQSPKSGQLTISNSPAGNHHVFGTGIGAGPLTNAGSTTGRSPVEPLPSPKSSPLTNAGSTTGRSQVEPMPSPKSSPVLRPCTPAGTHPVSGVGNTVATIRPSSPTPPTPSVGSTIVRSQVEGLQTPKSPGMIRYGTPIGTHPGLGAGTMAGPIRSSTPIGNPPIPSVGNATGRSPVESLLSPKSIEEKRVSVGSTTVRSPVESQLSPKSIEERRMSVGNATGRSPVESLLSPKSIEERRVTPLRVEEASQLAQPPRAPSPPVYMRSTMPSPSPSRRGRLVSPTRIEDRMQTGARCSSLEGRQIARHLRAPSPAVVLRGSLRSPGPSSSARHETIEERMQAVLNASSMELPAAGHATHAPSPSVYLRGLTTESPVIGNKLRPPSPSPRDIRCRLSVNDNPDVEVWSKTSAVWCKGLVRKVDGSNVSVEYALPDGGLSFKRLPFDHPEIKLPPQTTNLTPAKYFGSVVSTRVPLSPTVEIRHAALD